eukprot:CAMPEP_0175898814 /NCGR_PEP_ID=MMETSP0108-20121206/1455_1 /TAXON_ID=195067 ORGANISM="Goniomonas pacifica, Strain CCMP1869" /NCGR_SAMPLE_ID=MMETSP0108 /ASSEMBLY_ACC=CAM_ASM_000204 /LENGTH=90 /DNA_ID=CAMNT_0017220207 /DNA_START=102 /DNA_END=374 /DNA_ORIENTATION=-
MPIPCPMGPRLPMPPPPMPKPMPGPRPPAKPCPCQAGAMEWSSGPANGRSSWWPQGGNIGDLLGVRARERGSCTDANAAGTGGRGGRQSV